jgi:hypothetical protein
MVVSYFDNGGHPTPNGPLTDPACDPETKKLFDDDHGIPFVQTTRIVTKLGFQTLPASLTPQGMADLLVQHGPVIYGGQWPGSVNGHWVVITGISGNSLMINDPWSGPVTWDYNQFFGAVLLQEVNQPLIFAP